MARIFVTGSADGLGRMAATLLAAAGHRVVLHARNLARAAEAHAQVPEAEASLAADLSSIEATCRLATDVNRLGAFDAVIHNAGVGDQGPYVRTADGLADVFAVNTMAPYLLTALIRRPVRLIYLSSRLHRNAGPDAGLPDLAWSRRPWDPLMAYAESKLHDTMLAFAVARRWPEVRSNSVEPGWVATKMGGPAATDDLDAGPRTQVWLATSMDAAALVSGRHFYHLEEKAAAPVAQLPDLQERLLAECARISGVTLPA